MDSYVLLIGHNVIDFDLNVIEKVLGIDTSGYNVIDTLTLSRLYNPQLEGGHSLRAWGDRLGFPKGSHEDYTKLSPEMVEYCEQDCEVTHKLYDKLIKKLEPYGDQSIELEHDVQRIITKQTNAGWLLDQGKCFDLLAKLKQRRMEVEDDVHKKFKALPIFVKKVTPKYKKDGELSNVGLKFLGSDLGDICGEFSRIEWPQFNLSSRQQIAKHLQFFGWKPKVFTEKGHPIVDEVVLSKVKNIPEAQLIAEYILLQKRSAQVLSWIKAVDEDDHRVHGQVNPIGAVTARMTHSGPNMAQVPASYSPYGNECRACWIAKPGYKLVGVDASGLELRMLAHYMDDEEYTHEVTNGDVHTANQKAAGIATRDNAKTFIYAFLYGAGDKKIGSIVGGSSRTGAKLKEKFLENTPSLRNLRERVTAKSVQGYLKGLDGRKLIVRSTHASLNTLLQSAGAIIMKKSLTILEEYASIYNIDFNFVGNIHDEFQVEVREDQAEKFGWLAVECIKAAGIRLNLKCPLDGEYKVGDTWAETH
jgi:DNA polymerase I-like protein with 3'-5' exonuclease and polymerase domains